MRTHVLDASALYRYLTRGPGHEVVANVFRDAEKAGTPALMSAVTWGEVYYKLVKLVGLAKTDNSLTGMGAELPLKLVNVEPKDAIKAARMKAQHNLPYADSFAAALTGSDHVLVTSDVEHFNRVPRLRLLKLPSAKKAN